MKLKNAQKTICMIKQWFTVGLVLLLAGSFVACGNDPATQKKETRTYQVKPQTLHKTLFFTGTIQPIRESTLTNPIDAVIEKMPLDYGQAVKKGSIVFVLNSAELQKQYNDVLTDYLKAKDAFSVAKTKFIGTEDLWNAGLLSKNNYLSEKSTLNHAQVSLVQSTRKLSEMIEKMGDSDNHYLSSLSLTEFDKVRLALSRKHNQLFLKAAGDGILLYPPQSGDDKSGRLTVGSSVKSGAILALIGDMTGIKVAIDVPEVDIDKIEPGMKARVQSVVFPKDDMQGELVAINSQASVGGGNSFPSFSAIVEVKQLTPEQRAWVKVGMSATIEVVAESPEKIIVPIAAVQAKNEQRMVSVRSESGHIRDVVVTTGAAQVDKVVIESGLKAGDVVIYDNASR